MSAQDYAARAQINAPRTPAEVAEAARQLLRDGHTDSTIAQILGLDVEQIRRLLGQCVGCGD